jgi:hypothetical protein
LAGELHEEGLVAAVRRHAAAVGAREGFEVPVRAGVDRLPPEEDAARELFRVIQEALHNSVKHARPSRVDIRLAEPDGAAPGRWSSKSPTTAPASTPISGTRGTWASRACGSRPSGSVVGSLWTVPPPERPSG